MKNKKSSSVHEKVEPKRSDPEFIKTTTEIKIKKKATTSIFQKSQQILQNYNALFKKTTYHLGDADTYFRQTLRNYDDFELIKGVKWDTSLKPVRSSKSIDYIKFKERRRAEVSTSGDGDKKDKPEKEQIKKHDSVESLSEKEEQFESGNEEVEEEEGFVSEENLENLEEESDLEKFYSPNTQRTEELEQIKEEEEENKLDTDRKELQINLPETPVEVDVNDDSCVATPNTVVSNREKNQESNVETPKESQPVETPKSKMPGSVDDYDTDTIATDYQSEIADLTVAELTMNNVEELLDQANSEIIEVERENPNLEDAMQYCYASDDNPSNDYDYDCSPCCPGAPKKDTKICSSTCGQGTPCKPSCGLPLPLPFDMPPRDPSLLPPEQREGAADKMKMNPAAETAVMMELDDAERQAKETAMVINELRQKIGQLVNKDKMSEAESAELEEKNKLLKYHMQLFEEKTKRIEFLVAQPNCFESPILPSPALQKPHKEDLLPKVIICGLTEHNMPKIIVCDDKKKKKTPVSAVVPQFAKRLCESYDMQERLAAENADLEGRRYQLQEDLLNKDQTVESLQRKLYSLQTEMRMVCKENTLLSEKLGKNNSCDAPGCCGKGESDAEHPDEAIKIPRKPGMKCGKGRGICPAEVESRLQAYSNTTQQLERQLGEMENEVRTMQSELCAVQKERQHLEHHRRMMMAPPPCPPPCATPCPPPPCAKPPCPGPCNPNAPRGLDQQLSQLREQYNRLQDDYKGKLTEVAGLRADNEKLKQSLKDSEELKKIAEDKMKECEKEMKQMKSEHGKLMGSKEQLIEQEQQLNVAKQRFREAQDELEELRALIQDQQSQLDDYRNKYLQAQQQVEEQRRQIDMMEMENNRVSEQVNLEIQRVKNQFQEKLQELTPLPDILKATQLKLQEAQQMHLLAERNNEALTRELQAYRDRAAEMASQMEKVRSDQQIGQDEKATLQSKIDEWEKKCNELQEETDNLKTELARMEEMAEQNEKRVQEKLHEIAQLVAQLETVREESARQVARTKDRCETVRRSMQNQIADLERQLAQSRAQARAAQKDRDEIRQKMQSQINNLNENFEDAQMRIRNLQGHVNFLKNSYTNVFPPDPNLAMITEGMDPCDCANTY